MFHKILALAFRNKGLLFGLATYLGTLGSALAAVTVTEPTSTTAPVVFTFDTAVDTSSDITTMFYSMSPYAVYNPSLSWSAGDTILTCTPTTPWPSSGTVSYMIMADDLDAFPVYETGTFSVNSGGSGGGTGTNRITNFQLGVSHNYNQTSTGAPTLDTTMPFLFGNLVILASNRTATSVTVIPPTGLPSNLTRSSIQPEQFYLSYANTDSNSFNTLFPAGNYTNTIFATTSNQSVMLLVTNTSAQPPVPHITNFTAAQNVDPSQPFKLGWDTWIGGTTNDFIDLNISAAFDSPGYTMPGMLRGTSNSIVIPAGILQPNSNYIASLGFYRMTTVTTNSGLFAMSYRTTITQFTVHTTGGTASAATFTNGTWSAGVYSFDVVANPGATVTIQWSTNLPNWGNLLVTNFTGTTIRITDSQSAGKPYRFYRAQTGQ